MRDRNEGDRNEGDHSRSEPGRESEGQRLSNRWESSRSDREWTERDREFGTERSERQWGPGSRPGPYGGGGSYGQGTWENQEGYPGSYGGHGGYSPTRSGGYDSPGQGSYRPAAYGSQGGYGSTGPGAYGSYGPAAYGSGSYGPQTHGYGQGSHAGPGSGGGYGPWGQDPGSGYRGEPFQTGFGGYPGTGGWRGDEFGKGREEQGWFSHAWQTVTGPFTGKGPRNYKRSDERIREDVCDCLLQHGAIDATFIDVEVSGGEVTLKGTVRDRSMKRNVEDAIERVSGVREINNQLRVQPQVGHTEEGGGQDVFAQSQQRDQSSRMKVGASKT